MDKQRILAKIDELDKYLEELESIKPTDLDDYKNSIENKRACERLLQISIESVIDICSIIFSDLKLGLPADEDIIFEKLADKKIISKETAAILKNMKGFRNVLVHKYGKVEDEIVFELIREKLGDFDKFKEEILKVINKK